MEFPEFVNIVGQKIGNKNAFDIARDAKISALEKLLVSKDVVTQEELTTYLSDEFKLIVESVSAMPTLSKSDDKK